jgi:ABC-type uncharacterized transport system permease subunit
MKNKVQNLKQQQIRQELILVLLAIVLSFGFGAIILMAVGINPIVVYQRLFHGVVAKPQYIAWSLIYATPLILTGLSVGFAFQTGLFNIGAEGQFMMGAIVSAWIGYFVHLPFYLHVPLALLSGCIAGGLWAAIAGYLKAYRGIHEVVVMIMLNWVALYFNNFVTLLPSFNRPLSEVSYPIQPTAMLSISGLSQWVGNATRIHWGMLLTLIVVFIIAFILNKTSFGFKLKAVGLNNDAALASGINMKQAIIQSMIIAGILSGMAGAIKTMGMSFNTTVITSPENYGFNGLSVALIGMNRPIGILLAGIFYGSLKYSSSKLTSIGVPIELINILIGTIIYFIAMSVAFYMIWTWWKSRNKNSIKARG